VVDRIDILCPQYIELYGGLVNLSAFDPHSLHNFLYLNLYFLLLDNGFLLLILYFGPHLASFDLHIHTWVVFVCNREDILASNRTSCLIIVAS
jgi:hypothetical protein